MSTILDTPAQIDHFHKLQLMHALALEIKTGLKMTSRGSIMKQVNYEYKTKFTRKADALKFMEEIVAESERRLKNA